MQRQEQISTSRRRLIDASELDAAVDAELKVLKQTAPAIALPCRWIGILAARWRVHGCRLQSEEPLREMDPATPGLEPPGRVGERNGGRILAHYDNLQKSFCVESCSCIRVHPHRCIEVRSRCRCLLVHFIQDKAAPSPFFGR